jgi:hypothetical protein
MFSIPRVNVIQSDQGFSVEVLGRTGLRYLEGDRAATVDSEVMAGPHGLAVYGNSIKRWDSGELITDEVRAGILQNIVAAFKYRGLEIEIS